MEICFIFAFDYMFEKLFLFFCDFVVSSSYLDYCYFKEVDMILKKGRKVLIMVVVNCRYTNLADSAQYHNV